MDTWWDVFKSSFLSFPDFWLLLLISLVTGIRKSSLHIKRVSDFIVIAGFYGLFVYLIMLFSMGLWSWDTILQDTKVPENLFFIFRGVSLYLGYFLTKRYLYNHPEYNLKKKENNIAIKIFSEFVSICGSIAGYLVFVIVLLVFNSL